MSTYILTGEGFYFNRAPDDKDVKDYNNFLGYSSSNNISVMFGSNPFYINNVNSLVSNMEETRADFLEWIKRTIDFCKERGYTLNGSIHYASEYTTNLGYIEVNNNEIKHLKGVIIYVPPKYVDIIPKVVNMYLDEPLKDLIDVYIKNEEKENG
jgi:hypothetical protein